MKTPIDMAKGVSRPKVTTNSGRVAANTRSAGETGDYGMGKGKARIAEAFPADHNQEPGNEGGYRR